MENEIIKASEYGIEETKANELTIGLNVAIQERELLIQEFDEVKDLPISEATLPVFKTLRLKIVKNRTQGIMKWHKANKAFFLSGGKFVDAIKNKELQINESMESVLIKAENYYDNIEKEKLAKLQAERVELMSKYVDDADKMNLAVIEPFVFESFLEGAKKKYEDRIAKEKEEQEAAKAKELEQIKIKEENDALKAQIAAKEKADRLAAEKIEADKKAVQMAKEAELQAEFNKGDAEKVKDLKNDLAALKTKYAFESDDNKEMYVGVCTMLDKINSWIKK